MLKNNNNSINNTVFNEREREILDEIFEKYNEAQASSSGRSTIKLTKDQLIEEIHTAAVFFGVFKLHLAIQAVRDADAKIAALDFLIQVRPERFKDAVNLENCELKDLPESMRGLPITKLTLDGNQFKDNKLPEVVFSLGSLQELSAKNCKLHSISGTGQSEGKINNLPQLRELTLDDNSKLKISKQDKRALGTLQLIKLSAEKCPGKTKEVCRQLVPTNQGGSVSEGSVSEGSQTSLSSKAEESSTSSEKSQSKSPTLLNKIKAKLAGKQLCAASKELNNKGGSASEGSQTSLSSGSSERSENTSNKLSAAGVLANNGQQNELSPTHREKLNNLKAKIVALAGRFN